MHAQELSDLYYLTLLRMLGCTSGSSDNAYFFADEVAFGRDTQHLDYGDAAAFGRWVMSSFAADRPVAQMLASRLGFSGTVVEGVALVFERWDGSGVPKGVRGPDMPLAVRLMHLYY